MLRKMVDPVGHAPLLLALLMGNNNNNVAAQANNDLVTAGTVAVHEQRVEADYPHGKHMQLSSCRSGEMCFFPTSPFRSSHCRLLAIACSSVYPN